MRLADLDAVMRIEEQSYSHPWSRGIFVDCLRTGYDCTVYEQGNIIAYSICSYAVGEAHLLNLCVASTHRRQGIAQKIIQHLIAMMKQKGAEFFFLEVRASNQAAQNLYEKMGFNRIGQRYDYYPAEQGREDAWLYALDLSMLK